MISRAIGLVVTLVVVACGARTGLRADEVMPEVCDGRDNDGDGLVDEDIAAQTCGVGACARSVPGCMGGSVPVCVPGPPSREACDGLDNDCNGLVDDGLPFVVRQGPIALARGSEAEAVSTELEVTSSGLLAMWRVGFRGEHPMPTTRTRVLDADGHPAGSILTPTTLAQVEGPRATPSTHGDFVLAHCHRVGTEGRMGAVKLSAGGTNVTVDRTIDSFSGCGGDEPDVIWTGQRHLFAWTTNSGTSDPGYRLMLAVADEALADFTETPLLENEADINDPPRFAQAGARLAVVVGRRTKLEGPTQLSVYFLSSNGDVAGEPLTIDAPTGIRPRDNVIAAGQDGHFLIATQNDTAPGLERALVADGRSIEPLTELLGGPLNYSALDLVARGAGFVLAAHASGIRTPVKEAPHVFALDAQGRVTDMLTVTFPDEKFGGWPSVAVREGRVFVSYAASLSNGGEEVRLVELGCPEK
jgi:hypothetical protein